MIDKNILMESVLRWSGWNLRLQGLVYNLQQGTKALLITVTLFLSWALIQTGMEYTNQKPGTSNNSRRLWFRQHHFINSTCIDVAEATYLSRTNVKNTTLNILWINKPVWINIDVYNEHLSKCSCNCKMITDSQKIRQSAAIVFSAQENLNIIPKHSFVNRPKDQIWIFFRMEPPPNRHMAWYRNPIWRKTMNWSWGYRIDSDVVFPYGTFQIRDKPLRRNYSKIFKKKSRDAAWIVSNCHTQSRRHEYIKQLQNFGLQVDTFGKCSPSKRMEPWSEFETLINDRYKFYMSFENSFCKDYVTEKFFKYHALDTVLLVRGGLNYSKYFDRSTYINTADFASIRDVAAYLKRVGNNETLYTRFLREKDKYVSTTDYGDSSCILCQRLHNVHRHQRVYDDIDSYIHSDTCFDPKDIN